MAKNAPRLSFKEKEAQAQTSGGSKKCTSKENWASSQVWLFDLILELKYVHWSHYTYPVKIHFQWRNSVNPLWTSEICKATCVWYEGDEYLLQCTQLLTMRPTALEIHRFRESLMPAKITARAVPWSPSDLCDVCYRRRRMFFRGSPSLKIRGSLSEALKVSSVPFDLF